MNKTGIIYGVNGPCLLYTSKLVASAILIISYLILLPDMLTKPLA